MLKYRFDVWDALDRVGFNIYKAKKTRLLSQDAMKKLKNDDTSISLKALNNLCLILDMKPKDILTYEESAEDREAKKKLQFFLKKCLTITL